ncbi:hypothetical protein TNCV_1696251 [Trichonephila clavipes]|nr:hypothetical protein TNCV_1696251 [Trichonephila clavipes]
MVTQEDSQDLRHGAEDGYQVLQQKWSDNSYTRFLCSDTGLECRERREGTGSWSQTRNHASVCPLIVTVCDHGADVLTVNSTTSVEHLTMGQHGSI